MSLWRKKSITKLLADAESGEHGLKKTLTASSLVALGIGAIIGAGLFVQTARASAECAGNGVLLSFVFAAVGCLFAGLCYAEFASMIPIAGSAYTYAYTTMGELVAWIIGWALILEYALGAATVSIAWSEYLNKLTASDAHPLGAIPYALCHSPFEPVSAAGEHGIINLPAIFILFILSLLLIKGTQESARVNAVIVFVKVTVVLIFIAVGWQFIKASNHTPFLIPADAPKIGDHDYSLPFNHGWLGVLHGAGIVFFAFIGFDAVSTAAQETKNPKRDMPIGILGSLLICTILYVVFSFVLTGVAPYTDFLDPSKGKEASIAYTVHTYMTGYGWLSTAVTIAILAGFSSVILVMLLGQSRVFYSMSKDGLLPKVFSDLHPKFRTPYKSNIILFLFVGLFAAFVPESVAGDLTSIGTLLAFVLVCLGIIIMRKADPDRPRPFRTPLVPLVPILGILVCTAMIIGLDTRTILTALSWMVLGLVIFFAYSRHHSNIGLENKI